jgi:hypothetical protein
MRTPLPFPAASLALLLAACGPSRPPIPLELAAGETLPVKRKVFILFSGEKLDFGPFAVADVHRDDDQSLNVQDYPMITTMASEAYSFRLDGAPEAEWSGTCLSSSERLSRVPRFGKVRERGYRTSLRCDLRAADSGAAWLLSLDETDTSGSILRGILSDGRSSLEVEGTREREGRRPNREFHTGFEIREGEQALGEVIRSRREQVLLQSGLEAEEKSALAAAAAALLLYRDKSAKMKEMVTDYIRQDQSVSM